MNCDVCFYSCQESELFDLICCKNNNLCILCLDLLLIPQCPFCRTPLDYKKEKIKSQSFTHSHLLYDIDSIYLINPYDNSYKDSRTLQRQIKKIRKLLERNQHDERNKYLNLFHQENKKSIKKLIKQKIEEEIFLMED